LSGNGAPQLPPPPGSPDWASSLWNAPHLRDVPPPPPSTWRKGQRIPLGRTDLGDLIDADLKIVRWNWRTMIVTVLWLAAPFAVAQLLLSKGFYEALRSVIDLEPGRPIPTELQEALHLPPAMFVFPIVQLFVVTPLISALLVRTVVGTHLGELVEPSEALRRAVRVIPQVVWVTLLTLFISIGVGIVVGLAFIAFRGILVLASIVLMGGPSQSPCSASAW
jgi:hypothetical protein